MMNESNIGGLQLELLCFIADKYEPDVSALQEEYERWHDTNIAYQSVYQALERLNDLDYVEKKPIDGRSNCYMLTTKGAELLDTHRELVLAHTRQVEEALN
ncbi:DNA-binding protein [Halorubrum sp. SY-15]|uniref:DNA-binding protein n=1 Tax=Halorubrum sp. SY-15 TaxID=3402277 RepID=UPI003EBAFB0D